MQSWVKGDLVRKFLINERENFGVQHWCFLSTTPFCWGVPTQVFWWIIPLERNYSNEYYLVYPSSGNQAVVPQNFPSHLWRIFSQDLLWLKTALGLISSRLLLALWTQIRVWDFTRIIELLMLHMTFMDHYGPRKLLMSSFKSWIAFFLSQLSSWPKN